MVDWLLKHQADPNHVSQSGWTALHSAACATNHRILLIMLNHPRVNGMYVKITNIPLTINGSFVTVEAKSKKTETCGSDQDSALHLLAKNPPLLPPSSLSSNPMEDETLQAIVAAFKKVFKFSVLPYLSFAFRED
jgi:hypothetical protein